MSSTSLLYRGILATNLVACKPARDWSDADVKLAPKFRALVESTAGPHTIEAHGRGLQRSVPSHYTPYPAPLSTGVNFFAHNPRYDDRERKENGYCFPPIFLIGPAIQHLLTSKAKATVILQISSLDHTGGPCCADAQTKGTHFSKKGEPRDSSLAVQTPWVSSTTPALSAMGSMGFPSGRRSFLNNTTSFLSPFCF